MKISIKKRAYVASAAEKPVASSSGVRCQKVDNQSDSATEYGTHLHHRGHLLHTGTSDRLHVLKNLDN